MKLAFVGDIALGDHPKTVGFGFRSRYSRGVPSSLASRVRPPGPAADLLFGNLEFCLGLAEGEYKTLAERQCRGIDQYAAFLAAAGITVLNVANNHSSQHGAASFDATIALLRASGIHVAGTPADFTPQGVLQVSGLRIAIIGWSDRPRQYASEKPPYNEFSDSAYAQIAAAKARADVVLASIHWGDEFMLLPNGREQATARAMIDAGATCVIGHHPHVVREIEHYAGGVIAYSLGNFIGDMTWDWRTRFTGWLTARIEGRHLTAAEFTPGVIADDYFPRPLTDSAERLLADRITAASRSQAARVARTNYGRVAEAERQRHGRRTAWMMFRRLRHYPRGVAAEVLRNALASRVLGWFAQATSGPADAD